MERSKAVLGLCALLAALIPGVARAGQVDGHAVWISAGCGGCHTLRAAGATGSVGPNLDRLQPTAARVAWQVQHGGAIMPSFANSLSQAQIAAVAAYVAAASRGTATAPQAPSASSPPTVLPKPAPWVARLQHDLAKLGFFSGPFTGVYGPLTRAAVIRFQRVASLTADGRWGPHSQAALRVMLTHPSSTVGGGSSLTTPPLPPAAAWVARLQHDLAKLGFFAGPFTGIYGPLTRAAVVRFQQAAKLTTDGRWGPQSQAALQHVLRTHH